MLDLTPTRDQRTESGEVEGREGEAHLDRRSPLKQGLTIYQLCCESGFARRRLGGAIELSLAEAAQHDINDINNLKRLAVNIYQQSFRCIMVSFLAPTFVGW